MTNITINGEPRQLLAPTTVAALLESLELDPVGVAVAVNLKVLPRAEHQHRTLSAGDRVDVIRAVGGG
jgi:thiamine biosynthesis protein ThiS